MDFKLIGAVLGSISGATAGIAAIMYGLGYLITRANIHLLGLPVSLLEFEPSFYLERGGAFLFYLAFVLLKVLVVTLILAVVAVVVWEILWLLPLSRRIKSWKDRFLQFLAIHEAWLRRIAIGLLLALLVVHVLPRLDEFMKPLDCTNLLEGVDAPGTSDSAKYCQNIGNGKALFFAMLVAELEVGGLLAFAHWVVGALRFRTLWIAPFMIVFGIHTLLLPLNYGVLLVPRELSRVNVEMAGSKSIESGQLYLLNKTGQEFLLWDPDGKSLVWVPRQNMSSMKIMRPRQVTRSQQEPESANP